MDTPNKIALVTGGSRGLGKSMALQLAAKGLDVIITYHNRKDEADQVVSEIKNAGGMAAVLQLSGGNLKSFPVFFEQIADILSNNFGTDRFDYLVNNAGIGINVAFKDTTEEQFDPVNECALQRSFLPDPGGIALLERRRWHRQCLQPAGAGKRTGLCRLCCYERGSRNNDPLPGKRAFFQTDQGKCSGAGSYLYRFCRRVLSVTIGSPRQI